MSYSGVIAADGPSSWLRFNNFGSGAVVDEVLHQWGVPGSTTLINAPFTGIANDGGSYLITPLSAWTQISQKFSSGTPPIDKPLSGEVWIFPASLPNTTGGTTILQWGFSNGFCFLQVGGTGTWSIGLGAVGGCNLGPSTALVWSANVWLHLAWTWSSAGVFTAYRNGSTESTFSTTGSTCTAAGNSSYGIGALVGVGTATAPAFFVAEHATYTYQLSGAQIAAHYAAADQLSRPRSVSGLPSVCT